MAVRLYYKVKNQKSYHHLGALDFEKIEIIFIKFFPELNLVSHTTKENKI